MANPEQNKAEQNHSVPTQAYDASRERYGFSIDDYDISNTSSSTDCTGLMPSLPQNEEERESYEDIYRYTPPDIRTVNDNSKGPGK